MIEHFSKWLELVPLSNRSNEKTTYAFLDMVFNRFGVPVEVLINQGIEFHGEFQELCEKAFIDHRTTSQDHPEADKLAKQIVQMVK
jgi:hypothetical protein